MSLPRARPTLELRHHLRVDREALRRGGLDGVGRLVIGDTLGSRTDARRATEIAAAVQALNRMLELGRPEYVRLA